jgi:hypothetical protein
MQNTKYKYLNKRFTNKHGQSGFILKYVNAQEVYLKFDLTGWVGCFRLDAIRNGVFKDKVHPSLYGVGFIGDGKYKSKENGKHTKTYEAWKSMLTRCYSPHYQSRHQTYKGCSVAKEWHNYQCFAEWYENNYPKDGKDYHLDKDHLVKGNKIYSPNTCCFLTPQQNVEVSCAKLYKFISASGEIVSVYNLRKFCRDNALHAGHMCSVDNGKAKSHKGWTKA